MNTIERGQDRFERITSQLHPFVPRAPQEIGGDQKYQPPRSTVLRCPLPVGTVSSDQLRQYYRPGIPQFRINTN